MTKVGKWVEELHVKFENYSTFHLAGIESGPEVSLSYEEKGKKEKDKRNNLKSNSENKRKYDIY